MDRNQPDERRRTERSGGKRCDRVPPQHQDHHHEGGSDVQQAKGYDRSGRAPALADVVGGMQKV